MHPLETGLSSSCTLWHNPTRSSSGDPSVSIVVQCLTQSPSSLNSTCPNHLTVYLSW